jgi:hypothetical protein
MVKTSHRESNIGGSYINGLHDGPFGQSGVVPIGRDVEQQAVLSELSNYLRTQPDPNGSSTHCI